MYTGFPPASSAGSSGNLDPDVPLAAQVFLLPYSQPSAASSYIKKKPQSPSGDVEDQHCLSPGCPSTFFSKHSSPCAPSPRGCHCHCSSTTPRTPWAQLLSVTCSLASRMCAALFIEAFLIMLSWPSHDFLPSYTCLFSLQHLCHHATSRHI